jgi:tetratricopeptide (TPR) repeat protein
LTSVVFEEYLPPDLAAVWRRTRGPSMASSARIEELEKKFTENPRRYFAPLANEYRKAGDPEQAIAICRAYIPQQPAQMSGHIVFGQALFEAGQYDEAQKILEAALALDPENLIALRHLGDIARARGEVNTARGWYRRVLDADPRNEDVAALMKSLDTAPLPTTPAPAPEYANWAEINPERTLELPPGILDSISRDTNAVDLGMMVELAPSVALPVTPSITLEQMLQPPPHPEVQPGDEAGEAITEAEPVAGESIVAEAPGSSTVGGLAETKPAVEGDAPSQTPSGTLAGLEPMEFLSPQQQASPPIQALPGLLAEEPGQDRTDVPIAPTPAVEHAAAQESGPPAPFVTETMAELYLQQGFREEALRVYRQLLLQDPRDPTLRERVEQLERRPSTSSVTPRVSEAIAEGAQPGHVEPPRQQTVRGFFSSLATYRLSSSGSAARSAAQAADAAPSSAAGPGSGGSIAATRQSDAPAGDESIGPPDRWSGPAARATSVTDRPAPTGDAPTGDAPTGEPPSGGELPGAPAAAERGAGPAASEGSVVSHTATGADGKDESPDSADDDEPADNSGSDTLVGFGLGSAIAAAPSRRYEFDVSAYDAAELSGQRAPDSGAPTAEPPAAAAPASGEAAPPTSQTATEPAQDPSGLPRKPMQTGSVNVLFPGQSVAGPDETAAATLSSAFGGPTQPGAPGVGGAAAGSARPAPSELSLDSIFRESPAPAQPRRESSPFSFDQFFEDAPPATGHAATPRDGPATGAPEDSSSDAEQFSNWLAGLKKK